jgi:hypothetical protein
MVVMAATAEGKDNQRSEEGTRGFKTGFGARETEEGVERCCWQGGESFYYYYYECD